LFETVKVERVDGEERPARRFDDYRVTVDANAVPPGVTEQVLL
jgi:CRISPR-associated protein Csd2